MQVDGAGGALVKLEQRSAVIGTFSCGLRGLQAHQQARLLVAARRCDTCHCSNAGGRLIATPGGSCVRCTSKTATERAAKDRAHVPGLHDEWGAGAVAAIDGREREHARGHV